MSQSGESGIRTRGTAFAAHRISNPARSATPASLRAVFTNGLVVDRLLVLLRISNGSFRHTLRRGSCCADCPPVVLIAKRSRCVAPIADKLRELPRRGLPTKGHPTLGPSGVGRHLYLETNLPTTPAPWNNEVATGQSITNPAVLANPRNPTKIFPSFLIGTANGRRRFVAGCITSASGMTRRRPCNAGWT